nr:MAG TPA: hypothetical protein [Caudoviricetes sp.]
MVDSENSYTAGDDTGMELTATCIHATQAMVDALLASFKGKTYQMYSADDANLDPAAELGDGVTVAGVYSPLSRISDDGSGYPGINSPGEEELEDEYPAAGPMTQEFNRQLAGTRSLISKTSEEILLKVEGIDGKYTELKTTVDGVTVTDETGTTKIKGSSIETESIAAGSISADKLVLTGSITWADLTTDLSTTISDANSNASSALSTANGAYTAANGAQTNLALLANGQYQGGTFISGTSIYSPELVGDEIKLANGSSYEVGKISMQVSNTPAFDITSNLSLRLQSAAGWNAYLGNGYAEGSGSVAAVLCGASGVLNLYGAAIAVSGANFGSTLPSSGVSGQVFFLLG